MMKASDESEEEGKDRDSGQGEGKRNYIVDISSHLDDRSFSVEDHGRDVKDTYIPI
jgi:hypothetical protein